MTTILLAEDYEDFAARIATLLKPWNPIVLLELDGLSAVQRIEDLTVSIDLVITDLTMPRRTGWHVIEATRFHRPLIPVVMQSGEAGDEWVKAETARLGVPLVPKWRLDEELLPALLAIGALAPLGLHRSA